MKTVFYKKIGRKYEPEKLLQHDSVRKAYDHFMLMCELTKE